MKTRVPTREERDAKEDARLVRYYDNTLQRAREIKANVRDRDGLKVDRFIRNLFMNIPGVVFTKNGDHMSGRGRLANAQRRKIGNKAMKKWWDNCGRFLALRKENELNVTRGISFMLSYPIPQDCKDAK